MKQKRISIGDIAKQLNISITTVSFILNGKAEEKRISTELTKKVLKLVKEVGYNPNQLAKSLRTGKTNVIGLVVEDISNPFFANVARHIEEKANKRGYTIVYCSSENDKQKMSDLIKIFSQRQVDGYIITPTVGIEDDVKHLLEKNNRLVLFDRYLPTVDTNYVVVDNYGGSYKAAEHLAKQGFKKIGFVTISSDQTQMTDRLNGYKNAMDDNKLKHFIKKVSYFEDQETIIKQIVTFLDGKNDLDAVFFATNYLGIYGLEAITRLDLKIPGDIGVVSFDDHDLFRLFKPSITVVAQPIEEMSKKMIDILLDSLDDTAGKLKNKHLKLDPNLIIRNSSVLKIAAV